jgi:hypothetical protein
MYKKLNKETKVPPYVEKSCPPPLASQGMIAGEDYYMDGEKKKQLLRKFLKSADCLIGLDWDLIEILHNRVAKEEISAIIKLLKKNPQELNKLKEGRTNLGKTMKILRPTLKKNGWHAEDPWGNDYEFRLEAAASFLVSAGSDGAFDTEDDLKDPIM